MQVSVEAGEGLERRMRVDLPVEQVSSVVDKRLAELARTAKLPGFRPGKVPMSVLRQRFAQRVQHEVFGEMLQSSFVEAIESQSLSPVGMPEIEPDLDIASGRVAFTAVFEVMPEIELASLAGRQLKRPVCELVEADVDTMIQRLREQRKTWEPVERACQTGDLVTISFTGTVDGAALEEGSRSGLKVELGSGRMIQGFEEGLVGAKAGDQVHLDLRFPDDYRDQDLAGKPVHFAITLDEVAEQRLPELNADLIKEFGVEDGDLERFRAEVRRNVERELRQRLKARTRDRVMDLLLEANPISVPKALVAQESRAMAAQMRNTLPRGAELTIPESFFEAPARRRVATSLVIGKVVESNGFTADPVRVRELVDELAAAYEQPHEVVDHYYADRNRLAPMQAVALEEQVVDWVLREVEVEDEQVSFDTLIAADAQSAGDESPDVDSAPANAG